MAERRTRIAAGKTVLGMEGGADHAYRLVQHEVACRFAGLQQLIIQLYPAEFAYLGLGVAALLAIQINPALTDQLAGVLTVEARQVAEKAIKTHRQPDWPVVPRPGTGRPADVPRRECVPGHRH